MEVPFRYFLTNKLSQDHLEIFFSRIRRRGGWNNNPNCLQLKWSLRAILMKNAIMPSKNANVAIEEPTEILFSETTPSSVHHTRNQMTKFAKLLSDPSEFQDHVLYYMSGYIRLLCCVLLQSKVDIYSIANFDSLTARKDRGGLVYATDDIFKVVKTADKIMRSELLALVNPLHTDKNFIEKICSKVIIELRGSIFKELTEHFLDCDFMENDHFAQLIKKITSLFDKTVLHHHGRIYSDRNQTCINVKQYGEDQGIVSGSRGRSSSRGKVTRGRGPPSHSCKKLEGSKQWLQN
ncbi:hypothetical protein LOTGIDRAFT_163766 [Lottia gigantea]|uniref:Transposable element P transposase-like RNase H C-terminal domain-containing protein n=1 Tax=Lottia gigantea TaxID=225164 RepID=V4A2H8_LOTGI|nr:hypothetical protein LOTGIDRAFT_163766 [Lottia gigantea]ESO90877.1 hypothetical protein LOTGIDRAFT_163766 [Lottia gigantea]